MLSVCLCLGRVPSVLILSALGQEWEGGDRDCVPFSQWSPFSFALSLNALRNLPALESKPGNAQGWCVSSVICQDLMAEGTPGQSPLVPIASSISGAGAAERLLVINMTESYTKPSSFPDRSKWV